MDGDRLGLGIDNQHYHRAGIEPFLHFCVDIARTIIWRKDLDRQVWCAGEEFFLPAWRIALGADKGYIRGADGIWIAGDYKAGLRCKHLSQFSTFHKIAKCPIYFAGNSAMVIACRRHGYQLPTDQFARADIAEREQLIRRHCFLQSGHIPIIQ